MTKPLIAGALLALAAAPALADGRPPPPPGAPMAYDQVEQDGRPMMFKGMSEAGRRAVVDAMRARGDADRAGHERVRAARDRMLDLLSAERLDGVALRRAMDDEREAANAMRARRQALVADAFQGLSVADRRAFVDNARGMRSRFEAHRGMGRERMHPHDRPPPPPGDSR